MKRFSIAFLLVSLCAVFAFAQGTTGRLSGTVSGPDGVLPGATVIVRDDATGKETTVTTNEQGGFSFPQLEFGTYTVRVSAPGFKTLVANEQKIDVGREATLNVGLEIGDVTAEVVVTAGADVITSDTAQVSNTVSPQQILSLPLITRSPLSLTTLQSGVQSNPFQGTSINGMRTTMTNITRDGINIQDTFIRSNATDFAPGRPSVDDTAEFTITTTNQEADQGYGGAQIRLVTPRGTKDFSGALFAYNRNSAFAANNFFNNRAGRYVATDTAVLQGSARVGDERIPRPYRNRNQYGGKIGGPLPVPGFGEGTPMFFKDKGFFFFSYEGIKDPVTSAATRTIFLPGARNGEFRYNRNTTGAAINTTVGGATVTCPEWTSTSAPRPVCSISNILAFARTSLNNTSIPSSIDPIVNARVLSLMPTAGNTTGGDSINTTGFRTNRSSEQTRDQYATRIDVDISDKDSINFIYNYNKENNLRPDVDTSGTGFTPDVTQFSDNRQFTASYRRVFTPNFVNEIRYGLFTSVVPFDATYALPEFHISHGIVSHPTTTFMDQGRNTKAFNLQNNADYIWGKHNFKFGGQLQFFKVNAYNDAGIVPTYTLGVGTNTPSLTASNFSSLGGITTAELATANSFMALFGGIVSAGSQSFNVLDINRGYEAARQFQPFRHANHSLYLADRWQVQPGLTLSLGVRWEVYPALRLLSGIALEPVLDPDDLRGSVLRQDGRYDVIGTNSGNPDAYYKTQWNNFAPNLGVAWTPNFASGIGKTIFGSRSVIRAGYAHIFGNDSIITSINNAAAGNQGLALTTFNAINPATNTTALNGRLSNPAFPIPAVTAGAFVRPPRTYLQNNTSQFSNFGTVFAIDPNIEVPRTEQYSLGWQREFFGNTAFEIRYVGTKSDNLVRGVDFNQIDVINNGFAADFIRAQNNDRLCTATTGCTTGGAYNAAIPGSVQLTVFPRLPSGGLLNNSTILNSLRAGGPADLALIYITNNLNNHPTVTSPNNVPFVNFVPNPATGVADLLWNDGWYEYNSLQLEVRRRFSQGLYFQANYTFSKNLTNAVGTSQNLFEPYLDNNRKELDIQRADFDQTHTFNFNGVYQLPIGRGKRFLNYGGGWDKLFGGWELSGLVQWSTGAPITFVDPRGTFNRAARSARQTANTNLTADEIRSLMGIYELNGRIYWIDPSIISSAGRATAGVGQTPFDGQVFFNVAPGQTGTLGRTTVNGPTNFNINAALLKNIRFTERMRVQLRAEAFNLLNNVNFFNNTQFADINSTTFGQITSAGASRQMQFAVRFEF